MIAERAVLRCVCFVWDQAARDPDAVEWESDRKRARGKTAGLPQNASVMPLAGSCARAFVLLAVMVDALPEAADPSADRIGGMPRLSPLSHIRACSSRRADLGATTNPSP
jgi:hypothetical protein